jgi:hypothetical protein
VLSEGVHIHLTDMAVLTDMVVLTDSVYFLLFVGDDASLFSVELDHNGFFCGKGAGLCYVSVTAAYIDYCNTETWSII